MNDFWVLVLTVSALIIGAVIGLFIDWSAEWFKRKYGDDE